MKVTFKLPSVSFYRKRAGSWQLLMQKLADYIKALEVWLYPSFLDSNLL